MEGCGGAAAGGVMEAGCRAAHRHLAVGLAAARGGTDFNPSEVIGPSTVTLGGEGHSRPGCNQRDSIKCPL
jgi:hypothetical protein